MDGKQVGKLKEVHYFPVGEKLPAKYADWTRAGTFEVRDTRGAKVVLWRDFTKDERENMGEIDEARFAIAKTLHAMIHDVEVGRYLEWLAHNQAKKEGETIPGTVVKASEKMQDVFKLGEWVRVPDSRIAGTNVLKYGKLAGRYLPGPVWNDLRQTVNGQFKPLGETYGKILTAWKIAKTALSPTVHVNNIMSNFVMADWHDVSAGHTAKALRIMLGAHEQDGKGVLGAVGNKAAGAMGINDRAAAREVMNRYLDSGGNIGSWATNEITQNQVGPLLAAMEAELAASNGNSQSAQIGVMSALQHALKLRLPSAFAALKDSKPGKAVRAEAGALMDLYQSEDDVFRLAAWLKAKEDGKTDMEAGKIARRSFMDYHINAPWVQGARNTALPFIAFPLHLCQWQQVRGGVQGRQIQRSGDFDLCHWQPVTGRYLRRTSGYSRPQITRLVARWDENRLATVPLAKRYRAPAAPFARKYDASDIELLVEMDRSNEDVCGPAVVHLLRRAYHVYGDKDYERLAGLSVSHLYNLRKSAGYQAQRISFTKTRPVCNLIGVRKAPRSNGRAGWVRIDSVHQGDLDGIKGVYHITCVDASSQWQVEACVQGISEAFLLPVLELVIEQFPFVIEGFHSDNGSEYINAEVAKMLNKLHIEQTKSRSRHSNDNALAESKNASVVRKHMGYSHIPQKYAKPINAFYQEVFNPWLNLHRPCLFATEIVSDKGKIIKRYKHKDVKTPLECLVLLDAKGLVTFRKGITLEDLLAKAKGQTDLQAAQEMQKAKTELFELFNKPKPKQRA